MLPKYLASAEPASNPAGVSALALNTPFPGFMLHALHPGTLAEVMGAMPRDVTSIALASMQSLQ